MITKKLSEVPAVKNNDRKEETTDKKFYTGKIDRVFKTIFVQDNDYHLMEALLSECLGSKVKVLRYLYPELDVASTEDKERKVDVLVELDGKNILVELNTEGLGIRLRNFNYFLTFYGTRIKRGEDYLDNTEHILIDLSYNIAKKYPYKNTYYVQNEKGEHYVDNFKIIEFNMDKITKECYYKIIKGVGERYKYLCMLDLELNKLKQLSEYDNIVREYMDKLVDLNNDDEFRYVVSAEEDARLTQKLLQDYARDEGHASGVIEGHSIGVTEGKNEEKIEIAKKMINEGLDISLISKMTNLSKKEIEKLIK